MITLKSLKFTIDDRCFFKKLSMTFLPSSIILLQGHNGSGKTSLLKMLAGIQNPSEGELLFSKKQLPISLLAKPYCTYIGHHLAIKEDLSVIDNMMLWAKIYNSEMLIKAAVQYFELGDILRQKCSELSQGNKKKIALSRLIICPSKLWLLDEIDSNLDAHHKNLLHKLIVTHADSGGIVFLASHNELPIKTAFRLNLNNY